MFEEKSLCDLSVNINELRTLEEKLCVATEMSDILNAQHICAPDEKPVRIIDKHNTR